MHQRLDHSSLRRVAALSCALGTALIWQPAVVANAGVFFGTGHSVRLASTKRIQMVSEEVTISPGRGRTLGGADWVDYACEFELRNLTAEEVEIQVGFPLNSQFQGYTPADRYDEIELVQRYRFIARDEAETYHVRFVARDQEKRFRRLFLWTMKFAPGETRTLHVSYGMGISVGIASTEKDLKAPSAYGRKGSDTRWMRHIDACLLQWFGYVTETGASWAGRIERARFRIATEDYERCLRSRGWAEPVPGHPRPNDEVPVEPVLWHRSVQPPGGTPYSLGEGAPPAGIEWGFAPFEPGPELAVRYYLTVFPRHPDAMREFACRLMSEHGEEGADLGQLREIVLAWHGVEARSESVRAFVDAQVWYEPSPGKTEKDLEPEEAALLAAIDEVRRAKR